MPMQVVDIKTLLACKKGLKRRLKKELDPDRRRKLKFIKEEVTFLIEIL